MTLETWRRDVAGYTLAAAAKRAGIPQASAVVAYLEGKGDGQAIAAAGEVRLVAERRLGELLQATVKRGAPKKNPDTGSGLAALGVSEKQSSRAQQLASVPAETFDQSVAPTACIRARLEQGGHMSGTFASAAAWVRISAQR